MTWFELGQGYGCHADSWTAARDLAGLPAREAPAPPGPIAVMEKDVERLFSGLSSVTYGRKVD